MPEPPDVSIIIVSYNTRDMLGDALAAIPLAVHPHRYDVWVVDNNSSDGSALMVRERFPDVVLIENDHNPGFAAANNQAITQCSGRNVLLLNPDTEARPGSIAQLIDYCELHPGVGAIGPKLLNTDGTVQLNGARFPSPVRELLHYMGLQRLIPAENLLKYRYGRADFSLEAEVDQVSGACIMVPAAVLSKVGSLDDGFFMFFEEVEWCWRIKQAGFKVIYLPAACVVHHWMGSVRANYRAMERELNKSRRRYYRITGNVCVRIGGELCSTVASARAEIFWLGSRVKRSLRALKSRLVARRSV